MGKSGYNGGGTIVGPESGWFTFPQTSGPKRKNAKPLVVPERTDGSSPRLAAEVAKVRAEAAEKKYSEAVAKHARDEKRRQDARKKNSRGAIIMKPAVARVPAKQEEVVISHSRVKAIPVVVTKTKTGRIYKSRVIMRQKTED